MKQIIQGNLIFPDRMQYGQLIISNNEISVVILGKNQFIDPDIIIDEDHYISPGFIDIQINGAFGKEFKTDVDAVEVISNKLFEYGTTSFCPTITTSDLEKYTVYAKRLVENYKFNGQAKFIGLHLEGPFLNPQKVGAQNSTLLKLPNEVNFDSYINSDTKIVTLAPELDGAELFIDRLKNKDIRIGIGHSLINYKKLIEFTDKKYMMIVHLFNAMDGLNSREPGLVGAGLLDNDYAISLIVDGVHVDPAIINIIWRAKHNKKKIICISDGSAVTGLDNGVHKIGDRTIYKSEDKATLQNGTLVGSILTLNTAVRNIMKFTGCELYEAVNTVSLNPATYLGIENKIGQIKAGNKADLVIFDKDVNIKFTYIDGVLVYSA